MINRLFAIIMSLLLTALASAYGTDPADVSVTQDNTAAVYEESAQEDTSEETSEDTSEQSGIDAEPEEENEYADE